MVKITYVDSHGTSRDVEAEEGSTVMESAIRNSVPGSPDRRHHMGVYYQMKIAISDEKMTMRCLLDLSSIDPVERDAAKLRASGGSDINETEFAKFCRDYPRLVRRLRDQLGYNAKDVVAFLRGGCFARVAPLAP